MPDFFEVFQSFQDDVLNRIYEKMRNVPSYAQMPEAEVKKRIMTGLEPYVQDIDDNQPSRFKQYWQQVAYSRSQQGVTLEDLMAVLLLATREVTDGFRRYYANNSATGEDILDRAYAVTAQGIAAIYAGYNQSNAEIIAAQRNELQELSTPIIPIYSGILVLPLVGTIDSRRAGQILEGLLEGIGSHSADVVILDITGVPIIDTGVANYLLQSARAARLLGSQVVLVGIGAEIAQTIVQLGIDLSGVVTRANLQAGIEFALAQRGLRIMEA